MLPCPRVTSKRTFASPLFIHSLCTSRCLFLPAHLLNHKFSMLRYSCLVPGWSTVSKAEASSPFLHMANDVSCLRAVLACCTAVDGVRFIPVLRAGTLWAMHGLQDSVSVISSLTLEHFNSSSRLDARCLFYIALCCSCTWEGLTNELITLSSFSTFDTRTS